MLEPFHHQVTESFVATVNLKQLLPYPRWNPGSHVTNLRVAWNAQLSTYLNVHIMVVLLALDPDGVYATGLRKSTQCADATADVDQRCIGAKGTSLFEKFQTALGVYISVCALLVPGATGCWHGTTGANPDMWILLFCFLVFSGSSRPSEPALLHKIGANLLARANHTHISRRFTTVQFGSAVEIVAGRAAAVAREAAIAVGGVVSVCG